MKEKVIKEIEQKMAREHVLKYWTSIFKLI